MEKPEVKIISDLIKACDSLMGEVSQTEATNWAIVNDAMVKGQRYIDTNKSK